MLGRLSSVVRSTSFDKRGKREGGGSHEGKIEEEDPQKPQLPIHSKAKKCSQKRAGGGRRSGQFVSGT